jgi:hemerythrin
MKQMQRINVTGLFVEDHKRIASLLNDFKKHKHDGSKKTKELFKELNRALIIHFHQEELLYSQYKYKTGDILPILQTIRGEHTDILEHMNKIQQSLKQNSNKIDIAGLYGILERHKNMEERLLYPELDSVLSSKEKEEVYWKIKVK